VSVVVPSSIVQFELKEHLKKLKATEHRSVACCPVALDPLLSAVTNEVFCCDNRQFTYTVKYITYNAK